MEFLRRYYVIIAILLFIFTAIVYFVAFRSNQQTPSFQNEPQRSIVIPTPVSLDTSKYTAQENIVPLSNDFEKSPYSRVFQVRGKVISWEDSTLTMESVGNSFAFTTPDVLQLYCIPEFYTGQDGSKISAYDVFVQLPDTLIIGSQTTTDFRVPAKQGWLKSIFAWHLKQPPNTRVEATGSSRSLQSRSAHRLTRPVRRLRARISKALPIAGLLFSSTHFVCLRGKFMAK